MPVLFGLPVLLSILAGAGETAPARAGAVQACAARPASLVSWWDADAARGWAALDLVGPGLGRLGGGASVVREGPGQAFRFDGEQSQILALDQPNLDLAGSFSISAWVRIADYSLHHMIVTKNPGDAGRPTNFPGNYELRVQMTTGKLLLGFEGDPPASPFCLSGRNIPTGRFVHVAGVFDSGRGIRLYIDGVHDASCPTGRARPQTNSSPLRIGSRADSGGYSPGGAGGFSSLLFFRGDIDELELHSAALSDSEIGGIFAAGLAGHCKPPIDFSRIDREPPPPSPAPPRAVAAVPAPAPPALAGVDSPSYRFAENPDNFALVIGIERYQDLPSATYAERDAEAVRAHLLALGYPERNILYLSGSRALKSSIEKYVESWLPRNVTPKSRVFVYFSGHGAPVPRTGEAYLVPWDGDLKYMENTAYPLRRLYEKLESLKARLVVVALDSCFSGGGGRSLLAAGTRPLVSVIETKVPESTRLVIFSAAAADEITGVDEIQRHGLFSYHFLSGISKTRGETTLRALYDYLSPRVRDAARRANRDQTPQLLPSPLGERENARLR